MKKLLGIIKNKWLIKGTTTLLLVAIVLVCFIGLNILVQNINVEDLDFTEKKLYSLSDETKNKIKDLDKEVTIQLINMNDYGYIKEFAKKYSALTDKIKLEEVDDLSSRVDLKTEYDLDDTDSLIVVKTADAEKTLTLYDLYTIDYSTYEQIDTTEEAITNAIVELTIDRKPKIYILSTNTYYSSQQSLYTVITQLEEDSNEVEYLDILTQGEVPEDCDCLIITTLAKDITELERDKIIEYIQRGGKIMILTSQNVLEEVETPNYDTVLAEYGISMDFGVIFEQDTNRMLQNAPEFAISDVSASFMNNIDMTLQMCFIDAGKIEFADDEKLEELGVTYETIASTGEKSFIRTDFDQTSFTKTSEDGEEGSFIVGAFVTKSISDDINSELIIYSSEVSATDMQIPISSQYYSYAIDLYNNKDIILNSISYLTERTDTITIRKTDDTQPYSVTEQQDTIIRIIIFTIPFVIIFIGIIVWYIRKRRR